MSNIACVRDVIQSTRRTWSLQQGKHTNDTDDQTSDAPTLTSMTAHVTVLGGPVVHYYCDAAAAPYHTWGATHAHCVRMTSRTCLRDQWPKTREKQHKNCRLTLMPAGRLNWLWRSCLPYCHTDGIALINRFNEDTVTSQPNHNHCWKRRWCAGMLRCQ